MPAVGVDVACEVPITVRMRQVSAMFDAPIEARQHRSWSFAMPFEERPWNVGLIVGPSGSGKSTVARKVFGDDALAPLTWSGESVVDNFPATMSSEDIAAALGSVGFNTIPAWLRPYGVLSNGERFRADIARAIVERPDPIVVDEFSSVVDRQVAKVASHAVQRFVRQRGRRFVAVTCHHDVEEWLQPDWVCEPATGEFRWRLVQRRPTIECEIRCVGHSLWRVFAPFHYMMASLHNAAKFYALFVEDRPVCFSGILWRPFPSSSRRRGAFVVSRTVTLPDWQGIGLAFALNDRLAAIFADMGETLRMNPAAPGYVRAMAKSPVWRLVRRAEVKIIGRTSVFARQSMLSRPVTVFDYCGAPLGDRALSAAFVGHSNSRKATRR